MDVTNCKNRGCKRPIVWIRTIHGNPMPCNWPMIYYLPDAWSRDTVVTSDGQVIKARIIPDFLPGAFKGYRPHWGTCRNPADAMRKSMKQKKLLAASAAQNADKTGERDTQTGTDNPPCLNEPAAERGEQLSLFPPPRERLKEMYL